MGEKTSLGEFEHHVLLATLRLRDQAYTTRILRELEDRTGREVSAAAIYIALRRLEKHGLVRSALRTTEAEGQRRERRYFSVSPSGVKLAQDARRSLVALWDGLDAVRVEGG